jgi:hypothetical protein
MPVPLVGKKGYEYLYSLSKQGLSYVDWMKRVKPLEDCLYLDLQRRVMQALPDPLRNEIAGLAFIRAGFKYRGPARQMRLLENPAAPVMAMAARIEEQGRRNKEDQLELLKEIFRLQNRATQAEANVFNIICFLIALIKRGVLLVNYELLDQFVQEVAEIKSLLLRSMAGRNNQGSVA